MNLLISQISFGDHTKWLAAGNLVGIPLAPLCFFLFRQNSASFPGHSTFTKWDPSSKSKKRPLVGFIHKTHAYQVHISVSDNASPPGKKIGFIPYTVKTIIFE